MMNLRTLRQLLKTEDLSGKRVLVRLDLNVPMQHGKIIDDTRIQTSAPTIQALMKAKAKVIVLSHFGRPKQGYDTALSLAPIADALSAALGGQEVHFGVDCVGVAAEEAVNNLQPGEVVLLENLRFHAGEEKNDPSFVEQLVRLGDVYINDAFACSHRAHASIAGVAAKLPAYGGFLMEEEVGTLERMLGEPKRPLAAIVGGSKISTKLGLLEALVSRVQYLAIGGGMANTFLYAQGFEIGASLVEKDLKKQAKLVIKKAEENGCKLLLPEDVVIADSLLDPEAQCDIVHKHQVPKKGMILDIGPLTVNRWCQAFAECKTVVWNGPVGAFEHTPFDVGTISLSREISRLTRDGEILSVAGGGDILAALARARLKHSLTYISTAGGAFLEWLEGVELPGIKVLHHA